MNKLLLIIFLVTVGYGCQTLSSESNLKSPGNMPNLLSSTEKRLWKRFVPKTTSGRPTGGPIILGQDRRQIRQS